MPDSDAWIGDPCELSQSLALEDCEIVENKIGV